MQTNLVEGVLRKAFATRLPDIGLGGVAHIEHPRGGGESGMVSRSQTMTICSGIVCPL
jgi:hypothetical protein